MATAAGTAAPTLIGSVQRAMRLLEAVGAHEEGAPAKQLAREAGLALPTAYHLLRTLTHEGYLRREKGVFVLGAAAERLVSNGAQQNRRSMIGEALEHWRDSIGVPVYFAVYREGDVEVVGVADTPGSPAVEEWADFRETAHAHAIGQCLLSQLDEDSRQDHLRAIACSPSPRTPSATTGRCCAGSRRWAGCNPSWNARSTRSGRCAPPFPSRSAPRRPRWRFRFPYIRPTGCCPPYVSCRATLAESLARWPSLSVSENSLLVI